MKINKKKYLFNQTENILNEYLNFHVKNENFSHDKFKNSLNNEKVSIHILKLSDINIKSIFNCGKKILCIDSETELELINNKAKYIFVINDSEDVIGYFHIINHLKIENNYLFENIKNHLVQNKKEFNKLSKNQETISLTILDSIVKLNEKIKKSEIEYLLNIN